MDYQPKYTNYKIYTINNYILSKHYNQKESHSIN
jgi:hypothetical protein